jgi:hypothetical protein
MGVCFTLHIACDVNQAMSLHLMLPLYPQSAGLSNCRGEATSVSSMPFPEDCVGADSVGGCES